LGLDDRVTNLTPIPIVSLEKALSFYEEIKNNMPDFLPQFYSEAANIINRNYTKPTVKFLDLDDEDLPF